MLRALWDYGAQAVKNLFVEPREDNFEAWVVKRFGRKLFDIFFGVYTEKTWGIPCTQISSAWAAQRISQQSLWDAIKKSVFRPKGDVRSLVSTFHYPREGGVGEIARSYAREAKRLGAEIRTSTTVEEVLVESGRVMGARVRPAGQEAETILAEEVLNTMPCTTLARLCNPPADVLSHVDALRHRSMVFVYLVLDRPQLTPDHWIYIPEDSLTVHRLSEFKNFSDHCAPEDKTLICAEITCDRGDELWNETDENLREIAIRDLTTIGLIEPEEVLETFTHREVFAYPLYTLDYKEHLDVVLGYIDSIQGLDTTGRQGLFKYNNMDHSIGMGLTAGDNILGRGEDHRKIATGDEYFD